MISFAARTPHTTSGVCLKGTPPLRGMGETSAESSHSPYRCPMTAHITENVGGQIRSGERPCLAHTLCVRDCQENNDERGLKGAERELRAGNKKGLKTRVAGVGQGRFLGRFAHTLVTPQHSFIRKHLFKLVQRATRDPTGESRSPSTTLKRFPFPLSPCPSCP